MAGALLGRKPRRVSPRRRRSQDGFRTRPRTQLRATTSRACHLVARPGELLHRHLVRDGGERASGLPLRPPPAVAIRVRRARRPLSGRDCRRPFCRRSGRRSLAAAQGGRRRRLRPVRRLQARSSCRRPDSRRHRCGAHAGPHRQGDSNRAQRRVDRAALHPRHARRLFRRAPGARRIGRHHRTAGGVCRAVRSPGQLRLGLRHELRGSRDRPGDPGAVCRRRAREPAAARRAPSRA